MPQISKIALTINTGDVQGAGTDGDVYLGVCGREFRVDTGSEDFQRGSSKEYIFGDDANVLRPELNDPRDHLLFVENLARFPIYLRFQPTNRADHWFMQDAMFF
jgi:hypothetical protein